MTLLLMLFAYSGIYSVAASSGHVVWVKKLLEFSMQRSVKTWSLGVPKAPTDLNELARVQLGASHFFSGCSSCHGAPGVKLNAVHHHMLPPPPRLQNIVEEWTTEQLFWMVNHGIKYTGMPSWSGEDRDDEVWNVVAFLLQLPEMKEETYKRYIAGNSRSLNTPPSEALATDYVLDQLETCNRCHDTPDAAPTSSLVPRLAGQREDYLLRALEDYYSDNRQSGIMEPVATALREDSFRELARYYSTLTSPTQLPDTTKNQAQLERGRELAEHGDVSSQIPACNVCHTQRGSASYPLLATQSADYIESQLTVWKNGGRAQTPTGRLMATIAQRLSTQHIEDIAIYYQQLPAQNNAGASP